MDGESRPVGKCIAEILSYNGKMVTPERMMDIRILSEELGDGYEVKCWTVHKHMRTAVIKDGVQVCLKK